MNKKIIASALGFLFAATCCAQPEFKALNNHIDLGILIWQNPGKTDFRFKNTGNQALILKAVEPDCGCITVNWPKDSIAPGAESSISAQFDAQQLGHFDKCIEVYTNVRENPFYLWFKGNVLMAAEDSPLNYSYQLGHLGLKTNTIEFDDVERGDAPSRTIDVFNNSTKPITLGLMHLPPYLSATFTPRTLQPKRKGKIKLRLNSSLVKAMGLTQTSIYLSQHAGDRVNKNNEIQVSVTILPDVKKERTYSTVFPKAHLDSTTVNMGSFETKKKLKTVMFLSNLGNAPLNVDLLQVYNPGITVKLNSRTILPNDKTKITIKLNKTSKIFKGRPRILLITNDPNHPKLVIDVYAKN